MFNISKLSSRYQVRRMKDSDADDILTLFLQNTQYYQFCGKQPSKELILGDLHMTPPNTLENSKFYVGFYDRDILVAVMDLIEGYPDDNAAFIGFFMMNRQLQGNQIGTGIIQEVCQSVKESGMKSILLGIDKGNPQSTHFWKKNGFHVIREVTQEGGTILVAEKSLSMDDMKNAVLYIHGKGGSAAECEHYKPLFPDCEVYGLDYKTFTPWEAGAEIRAAVEKLGAEHDRIILIANSIGAFFSMNAGISDRIQRAYFISPIVDMERLILDMMSWAKVSEEELKSKGVVRTEFGEDLSWNYLCYVRDHPIYWTVPTEILYGSCDNLTSLETIRDFAIKHNAGLTVMEHGEHWFHTEEQMRFVDDWIRKCRSAVKITSERLTPEEYINFLKRTDLGSQYPRERFEARIARLVDAVSISLTARNEDGLLVGVLLGLTDFAYWLYVTDLGVDRNYTHKGIGKELMQKAHELAGGEKDIAVYLIANENAVPFYKKLGMKKAEDVMQYNHVEWTDFTVE